MAFRISRKRFTIEQYHHLAEIGVLGSDERVELLDGIITTMHPTTRRLFTMDDYRRMTDAGIIGAEERVELVEGELIETPPVSTHQQQFVSGLAALFRRLAGQEAVVATQSRLRFNERMELRPDLMLLDSSFASKDLPPTPSDVLLIAEVVGETNLTYTRQFKVPFYARAAIAEVWLVNPERRSVEVRTFANPAEGTYKYIERGGRVQPPMFLQMVPNVTVRVADVLDVV